MGLLYVFKSQSKLLKIYKFGKINQRSAVDLAHKVYGKGSQHIITLHGLLGSKKNWESMSKKIAETSQSIVVAADLRNHGESPHTDSHSYFELASDVSQLIDKLSFREATIIGHSMGGRTGMILALTEPAKVKRLVAVDISPISSPGILNSFFPTLIDVMRTVDFDPNHSVIEARNAAKEKIASAKIVEDINALSFILLNVGKRYDNKIGWMCNIDTLKSNFENISSFPIDKVAGKQFQGPTLFIGGGKSNYIPPSDLSSIQTYFPAAKLQYIDVGHNVHAEDPTTFHSMVTKFLAET